MIKNLFKLALSFLTSLHFIVSYVLTDVIYNFLPKEIGIDSYWDNKFPILFAVGGSILFGIGKEFYDKYHDKEQFSVGDLTEDISGAFTWMFCMLIGDIFPWAQLI